MYTKRQFAEALLKQAEQGANLLAISRWAHRLYLEETSEFEPGLIPILMKLIAMEEGPEFEYTIEEIRELAYDLLS